MFHFCNPRKRYKTFSFLLFSGGIKVEHLVNSISIFMVDKGKVKFSQLDTDVNSIASTSFIKYIIQNPKIMRILV